MKRIQRGRLLAAGLAVAISASTLAACGGDDDPVPGIESGITGQSGDTSANGQGGVDGGSGNAPESAGDRNPDAPDKGISEKPGGPNQADGVQNNGKSGKNGGNAGKSGGVTPPPPPAPVSR